MFAFVFADYLDQLCHCAFGSPGQHQFNGEIISADSRSFYKHMDIGTAKPSLEERERVKYYMVDIAEPDETLSLAIFQKTTKKFIKQILEKGNLPFIVGGSGQYFHSIIYNWESPAIAPQQDLRKILDEISRERGKEFLHNTLLNMDPIAAEKIDPRNVRRTIRALEVIMTTGELFSSQRKKSKSEYDLIIIGLTRPRPDLYDRIDHRIEMMFENGFIKEVESLINSGYSETTPSMSAIGYRECIRVINGEMTEIEAVTEIKRLTRIFVRRQANWFKSSDPKIKWFDLSHHSNNDIEKYIQEKITIFNTEII